ncbi:MAG TPA: serine hydrolase, partial [Herpetosiphonaceae bacterium]|nr:serine hydrolase [Herpetosiphonaceae bacterium]
FVNATESAGLEMHSLMLLRHGRVVAEGWWAPYAAEHPHMLFSLSKSFTTTAVGFAVAEGRLSVDDRVVDFFPEDAPAEISPNLSAMRVRHLLGMSCGHDADVMEALFAEPAGNWTRAFLAQPVQHAPGSHFAYDSGTSYMLSAIVQRLTGMTVLEYLRPRLLDPLGIEQAEWWTSPQGVNVGGWGLSVTTESIARFGQFYLQRGVWGGRQLLPAEWVAAAGSRQTDNGGSPNIDSSQGYGYQFWLCRHGAYRGDGAFGQFCVIMPEQDAVLAITGGVGDMQAVLNLAWDILLPAMGPDALPENPDAHERLLGKLRELNLPVIAGRHSSPLTGQVSGREYRFEPNPLGVESMRLDFDGSGSTWTVRDGRGEHQIAAGHGEERRGTTTIDPNGPARIAATGAWISDDTYVVKGYFYESPFNSTITWRFAGDELRCVYRFNVSFGPTELPELVGRKD